LGLKAAAISSQVIQRDRHANYLATLAVIASTLDKIATEIRHLQRTEVREVEEYFSEKQKGSSAMPHKRNPVNCERVCGLARVLRGHAQVALENVALWHERDISHSSAERVILPDAFLAADFMTAQMREVIQGLHVYPERMRANLDLTRGLIYSQRVLLALIATGMTREDAYAAVQRHSMAAWKGGPDLEARLASDPAVSGILNRESLHACFDPSHFTRHVNQIFERVLGEPIAASR
jgi:adenylosuccinate lyase